MKNFLLLLSVFFTTFFTSAQTPTDLFFSEYAEGSGNNKGVEIYNPTDQPIDLSNYYVLRFSNGNSIFTSGGATQLVGTIEPYTTHVLVNGQTTSTPTSPACSPEMQALADQLDHDYPAPTYMNGNDAIALVKTPNGEPPNADMSNVTPVDLIGEIGLGSVISAETGWSYVQDSILTYSGSAGDTVTGQVINYIVQKFADDGTTYGPFWMSWTSDHSLIRNPEVIGGVLSNPSPFIVTQQWDTVPGQLDTSGYFVYKDIWDNLGTHSCIADPSAINELIQNGTMSIYPNPVVSEHFTITSDKLIKSVQVFDLNGKEVYNKTFESLQKEAEVEVGQKYLGIYLVKATFSNNNTITQKILFR
jgi:hypothetical protein